MEKKHIDNMLKTWATLTVVILSLLGFSTGCSKEGGCINSTGPVISEDRTLLISEFDTISLNDYVNLVLTQGPVDSVRVEAGRNIIKGITTEVINRTLIIHNQNTCNWLRSYKSPINVYISFKNLCKITYNSSGDIRSTNDIKLDSLNLQVWGGCGTIDLSFDSLGGGGFSINQGTADVRLRGFCYNATVYSGAFGVYDGRELKTRYTYITSKASNDCYVKVIWIIDATATSIGNIFYTGNPNVVKAYSSGSGKVIPF